jgi:hypothetical protein
MNPTRTVSISINRDAADVYAYLSDPANFPRWSLFITSMERDGDEWIATTTDGTVRIRFAQPNHFGVVDHWVQIGPQVEIYVPLRVVRNGEGSEVMFPVFRMPGMSDEQFERDLGMVTADLGRLKEALEAT